MCLGGVKFWHGSVGIGLRDDKMFVFCEILFDFSCLHVDGPKPGSRAGKHLRSNCLNDPSRRDTYPPCQVHHVSYTCIHTKNRAIEKLHAWRLRVHLCSHQNMHMPGVSQKKPPTNASTPCSPSAQERGPPNISNFFSTIALNRKPVRVYPLPSPPQACTSSSS